MNTTRQTADKITDKMTDKFQDLQKRATETAKNLSETTDKYVRENTWSSVGLAALVGCVIGYLLANRGD